jgi:hypothetical protein
MKTLQNTEEDPDEPESADQEDTGAAKNISCAKVGHNM